MNNLSLLILCILCGIAGWFINDAFKYRSAYENLSKIRNEELKIPQQLLEMERRVSLVLKDSQNDRARFKSALANQKTPDCNIDPDVARLLYLQAKRTTSNKE